MTTHEIENKLIALKIPGTVAGPQVKETPFFKDYYIKFNDNVTYNKVMSRKKDLEIFFNCKLSIDTQDGFYILHTPKKRDIVKFDNFIKGIYKSPDALPLALGIDGTGKKLITDLTKIPHLLIAGATGSGKSVFLNTCIMSLIHSNNCGLCLIDCKRVEFSTYDGIITLSAPVAYTPDAAAKLLNDLCYTMDCRYKDMQRVNARNIQEYNKKADKKMQYIVCFIDEINDLLMHDKKTLEPLILRIAQLGRAAGIHLVIATQRPSSDCLSGLIKANIPGRVAFSVSSKIDSQVIINTPGAESLHGNGDGIYINPKNSDSIRFQAPFIDTEYINQTIEFYNMRRPKTKQ